MQNEEEKFYLFKTQEELESFVQEKYKQLWKEFACNVNEVKTVDTFTLDKKILISNKLSKENIVRLNILPNQIIENLDLIKDQNYLLSSLLIIMIISFLAKEIPML
ncbi:MAG: hypothetical protein EOM23_02175 [Candidatus Moranbacteria bacterium]|nr:hypothetical protein [Candidatus Moranbacteria bacterium]